MIYVLTLLLVRSKQLSRIHNILFVEKLKCKAREKFWFKRISKNNTSDRKFVYLDRPIPSRESLLDLTPQTANIEFFSQQCKQMTNQCRTLAPKPQEYERVRTNISWCSCTGIRSKTIYRHFSVSQKMNKVTE